MAQELFPFQPDSRAPQEEMPEFREGSSMTRHRWGEHPVVPYSLEEENVWMRAVGLEPRKPMKDEEIRDGEGS